MQATIKPAVAKRAAALARSAGALTGAPFISPRDGEATNAFVAFNAHCVANNLDPASTYADASQADPIRRNRAPTAAADKPAAKPRDNARASTSTSRPKADKPASDAKPDKPSKPADTSKSDAYAKREALVSELRATSAKLYNGPSLAVRSNPKRVAAAVYSDLLASPKHRTDLARISARDESFLYTVLQRGGKAGSFDPVTLNLDSGVFSRLASVGFIAADGDAYTLTADALAHARKAAKRAA